MTLVNESDGSGRSALRARLGRLLQACRLNGRSWLSGALLGSDRARRAAAAGVLAATAVLVVGCSGSQHLSGNPDAQQATQPTAVDGVSAQGTAEESEVPRELRELSLTELNDGRGVLVLGVSKLLEDVGVLELLESYIINIPPTAEFLSDFELAKAQLASHYMNLDAGDAGDIVGRFEAEVLYQTLAAGSSLTEDRASAVLHDAFFEALADCGRNSRWPDVELFVIGDGRGYDMHPDFIEPTFAMSHYEFQTLKHECARHAATYPSLDEALRDELLAPQRKHYGQAVLEGLADNPAVEVPARYRAELNELKASGW